MPSPFRRSGLWLRRFVLPLVGFWDLLSRLEELQKRVGQLETTTVASHALLPQIQCQITLFHAELAGRVSELMAALTARDAAMATAMAAEVERLDGYNAYHAASLRDCIAEISHDLRSIQHSLSRLNGRQTYAYTAPGLNALVSAAGYDVLVPTEEVGLMAYLLRHGATAIEPGVHAVLRDHLRPGAIVVDAGANIGIHSIIMASTVGSEGSVICFEPLPHLANALKRTLHLNGFGDRVRVLQLALSDTSGEATFYRAAHGPMSSLYALSDNIEAEPILVRVITLDECFAPGARVDFVKMDVEGAEPRVWHGMRRILEENEDIEIVLEWSSSHFRRSGEDPSAFMSEIEAAGFSPFLITDNETAERLIPFDSAEVAEAINLLLTRRPDRAGCR
jgi:FkbM family methyltransferase